LREDVRFKNVGPDVLEMSEEEDFDSEDGLWFDWPFVEFLKNNYCKSELTATALMHNLIPHFGSIGTAINFA
jgi:hypothetical protein